MIWLAVTVALMLTAVVWTIEQLRRANRDWQAQQRREEVR